MRTSAASRSVAPASVIGWQLVSVAVGWQLYERTHDPWSLGLVGLFELIPVIFLIIPAGIVADRFPRRNMAMLGASLFGARRARPRQVERPRDAARVHLRLPPRRRGGALVPAAGGRRATSRSWHHPRSLARVNAWLAATFETASIGGPALAGILIAATKSAALAFGVAALLPAGLHRAPAHAAGPPLVDLDGAAAQPAGNLRGTPLHPAHADVPGRDHPRPARRARGRRRGAAPGLRQGHPARGSDRAGLAPHRARRRGRCSCRSW